MKQKFKQKQFEFVDLTPTECIEVNRTSIHRPQVCVNFDIHEGYVSSHVVNAHIVSKERANKIRKLVKAVEQAEAALASEVEDLTPSRARLPIVSRS